MNETVELVCPICGRRQVVDRWMWEFSRAEVAIGAGFVMRGHPLTCTGGGGNCPSDTEMVLVEQQP